MKKIAFALAALSMSAAASAQVYGSLGLGVSNWSGNDSACVAVSVCDREDTSYRAVLGYRFNSWIAIEGGYIGFGKMKTFVRYVPLETLPGAIEPTPVPDREIERFASIDAAGPALGVAFTFPAGDKLHFVGRAGLVSVQAKQSTTEITYKISDNTVVTTGKATGVTASWQPYFGAGIGYRLTRYLSLDGSFDVARAKYGSVASNDKARLMALNVGLTFDF